MLSVEIALPDVEELHKLVQDGLEKGFLTYDEIVAGLEEGVEDNGLGRVAGQDSPLSILAMRRSNMASTAARPACAFS